LIVKKVVSQNWVTQKNPLQYSIFSRFVSVLMGGTEVKSKQSSS